MPERSLFRRIIDELGKSGLILRGDPPKVIDLAGREWGQAKGGMALSLTAQGAGLSVVLRNVGEERRVLAVPGWLHFFEIFLQAPDGSPAALTSYGRRALQPGAAATLMHVALAANQAVEVDVPIAVLYQMQAQGTYSAQLQCAVLGIQSNRCVLVK